MRPRDRLLPGAFRHDLRLEDRDAGLDVHTLFFVFLGVSAAIWGGWLERVGPRKAGVASALCWCGGMAIMGFGGGAMIGSPLAAELMKTFASPTDIGVTKKFGELDKTQLGTIAGIAAGFTALLSLFNIGGRFFWASLSDIVGRKTTYVVFFVLGGVLYASIPGSAAAGSTPLFIGACCIVLSMYGGGFATVPAYLADLFGTQMVGAIHGRLPTSGS